MSSLLLANHYCFLNANCQITFFIQQNISTETLKKFDFRAKGATFIFRVKIFEFQHQNLTLETIIFGRENSNIGYSYNSEFELPHLLILITLTKKCIFFCFLS